MRRSAKAPSDGSSPRGGLARPGLFGLACLCVLALGAFLGSGASAMAASGEGCANESVRDQSSINSVTGQPFSVGLPECRAYEVVSPLDTQNQGVRQTSNGGAVSADGNAASFASIGAFSNPQGSNGVGGNSYVSDRGGSGWSTYQSFAPGSLIPLMLNKVDYSSDMSRALACSDYRPNPQILSSEFLCAVREPDGTWDSTPKFATLNGDRSNTFRYLGASDDLSHAVFSSEAPLVPGDTNNGGGSELYEMIGVGGSAPRVRLVSVDDDGNLIGSPGLEVPGLGGGNLHRDQYQAVSDDGNTIYFTARPTGGVETVYARTNGEHTVTISAPHCTTCDPTPADASYQGASRDGSKVFFLTNQQLLDSDTDTTRDLYEYDFDNSLANRLLLVSGGGPGDATPGAGASVQGVVRTSQEGNHVYFVAQGVLTTLPNGRGQTATAGADNLYSFERDEAHPAGETKFVATVPPADAMLWETADINRQAQATPDGRYLIFATSAQLITSGPEADTDEAADIYRYDSQTGQLNRISIGEPGFPGSNNGNGAGFPAIITAPMVNGGTTGVPGLGSFADVNDVGRNLSSDGSTVIFITSERLQADDVNGSGVPAECLTLPPFPTNAGCDVYEWHNGVVNMISDGQDPSGADNGMAVLTGTPVMGMSASGDDIFFATHTSLVGQDLGTLQSVYDARIGGGFPYSPPTGCTTDQTCQGVPGQSGDTVPTPGSSSFSGPGNPPPSAAKKHPKQKKHQKKNHKKKHHRKRQHRKKGKPSGNNATRTGHGHGGAK